MRYRFENYVLDIARHELRDGDAALSVEPQVFDLLAYLIQHRQRVVSKEDLLANIWEGRSISDSTFTSRINSARAAIGDSGEEQRLIRTVPRRGYRFVGSVREQEAAAEVVAMPASPMNEIAPAALAGRDNVGREIVEAPVRELAPIASRRFHATAPRTILMLSVGAAVGAIATTLLFSLWPGTSALRNTAVPAQRFDATTVPLITDEQRRTLEGYPGRLDFKVLAVAREGWSVVDSAPDIETAKQEALRQCGASAKGVCRIYAVGMDVVWSRDALQLPAPRDLHSEPLEAPLIVEDIPTLNSRTRHDIAKGHMSASNHKALALTTRGYFWVNELPTRTEPARLAVERCTELTQRACLLLAVDGFLTIQIPKSREVTRIFLPSTEAEIASEDRERIGRIYQGQEWRALARGKKGSWHPVAAAPSEAAAIEGALRSCSQVDDACQLYAIGNFRVAEE